MKLKIYADKSHYVPDMRKKYLTAILKAHWNERSQEERRQVYGVRADLFEVVDHIADADVCMLPMTWDYYLDHHKVDQAMQFARQSQNAGKALVVWSESERAVRVPIENAVLFQQTLNRSRRADREYATPPFFDDNVPIYLGSKPCFRQKAQRPVVGFCGQAGIQTLKLMVWRLRNLRHWGMYHLGIEKYEPPPIEPPVTLRSKVLKLLSASPLVETNFLIRDRYRGGVTVAQEQANPHEPAKREFIDNLNASDYVVCIRGAGNWSKRFYEALNWGRIPVFIDTDCVLPYDFAIEWKKYCVWVEHHDLSRVAQKIADFHNALSPDDFGELQQKCRQIWQEWLSADGFYRHFSEHFSM